MVLRLPRSPAWLPWVLLGVAALGLLLPWLQAPVASDESFAHQWGRPWRP
ncbi:hypothetical protein [Intrasporangium sp.]|nr:hypothetical protein [Intrasporangium sp.]MDV3221011.1 hypothetical protein [Intrasporangium sp.]